MTSRFWDTGFLKIGNARNDPRMTLSTEVSKVPCVHWIHIPEAQISLCFALRLLIFQIIEVFGFPIGYNGEIQKLVKNRKLKISKIQNNTFVKTTEKKIQKKVEKIQKWFKGGVAFWSFGSHVNENEKYL